MPVTSCNLFIFLFVELFVERRLFGDKTIQKPPFPAETLFLYWLRGNRDIVNNR